MTSRLLPKNATFFCAAGVQLRQNAVTVRCSLIEDYRHILQVFARTSPEQKEMILKTLRAGGQTTLMCGDGTNDVGALKARL